jgi:hypothetical protein
MSESPRIEVEFPFNGKKYFVRPTFKKLTQIESVTDQPARTTGLKAMITAMSYQSRIAGGYGNIQEISIGEMALVLFWILQEDLVADKNGPQTPEDVGNILMDDGFLELCIPVGQFLTRAQRGNKEHIRQAEKERKKEEEAGTSGGPTPGSPAEG